MSIRLAIFDVDGTLLRGDTACQTIAHGLGKYERMCEMERVSDTDEIVACREEMAGWYLEAGKDAVTSLMADLSWAPGAPAGVDELHQAGVGVALASVTWSFAVEHVANELGIDHFNSTELDFATGAIRHTWGATKATYLYSIASKFGVLPSQVAAVGDSSGDYEMLKAAGLPIFVGDSVPDIPNTIHMPAADVRDISKTILSYQR